MKTIEVVHSCDLCESEPATELRFEYKGKVYAVDLCDACKADFNRYWQAGTLVKKPTRERK